MQHVRTVPQERSSVHCAFAGCDRRFYAKDLCQAHYYQASRGATLKPVGNGRGRNRPGFTERAVCWVGARGYVYSIVDGQKQLVHRLVMEEHLGRPLAPTAAAVARVRPRRPMCAAAGCDRLGRFKEPQYCQPHAKQLRRTGRVQPIRGAGPSRGSGEWYVNEGGYRVRPRTDYSDSVFEHRQVMDAALGRALYANETVHHRNGDRLDNRVENLELWARSHPPGQRVVDLQAWASEFLRVYTE